MENSEKKSNVEEHDKMENSEKKSNIEAPFKEHGKQVSESLESISDAAREISCQSLEQGNINKCTRITKRTEIIQMQHLCCVNEVDFNLIPRSVYFFKCGTIPDQSSLTVDEDMKKAIEFGVMSTDCLKSLETILHNVYVPLLELDLGLNCLNEGIGQTAPHKTSNESKLNNSLRSEFRANIQKFENRLSGVLQQVNGDANLNIPDISLDDNEIVNNSQVVSQLEMAVVDWGHVISETVESENRQKLLGRSPMAEIEFWRRRCAVLGGLYEQVNASRVQHIIGIMESVNSSTLHTFKYRHCELNKLHAEAKDNVKFLMTIERHFKNIIGGNLEDALATLTPLMNGLKMVWVLSRHFNTDERLVPLMELIAGEIAKKVENYVSVHTVVQKTPETAKYILSTAQELLDSWQSTYLEVRASLEESGTDHRWEFDRKRLFEQTNYMARICSDLSEVAVVLDQFQKFLGPELKSVTGKSEDIDAIMQRVHALVVPFDQVQFDVFSRKHKENWNQIMAQFRRSVEDVENMTCSFIQQSFQMLRSAEGAFDLVVNFKNIQSRERINQAINERYKDILYQYTKELDHISSIFQNSKENPPTFANLPPVAGAIAWSQSLFQRAKKPIKRFNDHNEILKSNFGENVKQQFFAFARSVHDYADELYLDWKQHVHAMVMEMLKQPILCAQEQTKLQNQCGSILTSQAPPHGSSLKNAEKTKPKIKNNATIEAFKMPNPPYCVNFAPELLLIIREAKHLDHMKFQIPELALNVALQEEKFHKCIQDINIMLDSHKTVLSTLTFVERNLLAGHLHNLELTLQPGFTSLNWNSQRIPNFIQCCLKAVNEFGVVVDQVHKSKTMISEVIDTISGTMLIQEKDFRKRDNNNEPVSLSIMEFYDILETKRSSRLDGLVQKYASIQNLLIKVEEAVAGTNSGKSPVLAGYYYYWEKRMFNALTTMIIAGMVSLQDLLQLSNRSPFCEVHVSLNGKDIVVTPAINDIYKYLTRAVKNIIESAKSFTRWMHGTCIPTLPQVVHEEDEPFVFSFYQDMSQSPHIVKLMLSLHQHIHTSFSIVNKYLDGWRRYDTVYNLWNLKRRTALETLTDKNYSCVYFDSRISSYAQLAENVRSQASRKDIEFLTVDCFSVATGVAIQADQWKIDYATVLHKNSNSLLESLVLKMKNYRDALMLDEKPANLEMLKSVLGAILNVKNAQMDMELEYTDITERYRTLANYNFDVPKDEMYRAMHLSEEWNDLYIVACTHGLRLKNVKEQFKEVTRQEADAFNEELKVLKRNFLATGPGSASISLESGAEMMLEYVKRINEMQEKKAKIRNAEDLFGIDQTEFEALTRINVEFKKLIKIYDLYSDQRKFEEDQGKTPWNELDINALQRGADNLERKIKNEKDLRDHPTFIALENRMTNFKGSIPLIVKLKSDAVKGRHWKSLMNTTGIAFDLSSFKSTTLSNIFAMELNKYSSNVDDIVNTAMQEQKIETELLRIESHWKHTELQLSKFTSKSKTDSNFCYVLRSADEIKLELEDHALNLQTMSSSRFVGSFSDAIRQWEKTLYRVNEIMNLWFTVQRKWMYLESIFVGAEDIRLQLPEEAKRFDSVDKTFKGIMTATYQNSNVIDACMAEGLFESLQALSTRLDKTQKSLSDYLDIKRNAFSRFYFISDDELLSVLGSSDPSSIQGHLLKLFDNVKKLKFSKNGQNVVGMESSEGESFDLKVPVSNEGPVENWMNCVELEMCNSLRAITKEGIFRYAKEERGKWIASVLGMVSLSGSQIWWTWEVEDAFRQVKAGSMRAMKDLEAKLSLQLDNMVFLVREPLQDDTRRKVNTILIIDVHARDIVDAFVRESVLHAKEFAWESQLRFYWNREADDCIIKQCTGSFRYGYEYMGMNGRLVMTPLTDRCYMTLTQALTFHLGGAPAGPAGTGKTETIKDLAKSLALACFVINCGEGLDYKAMGSIFAGLAQVGAWGCFDEFNRINIEVLSVVSAQLKAIQNALITGSPNVDIGIGGEIRIKRIAGFATSGIFITMNPGYAGRTELPDNLKALFRPVTMIVPDLLQICEIMLFSEGFEDAKMLAKKMTVLYKLGKEQLSKQYHYDFGLRALKSVLVMAGSLKRQYSNMSEDLVLMRALRDTNMPKFIFEDVSLFYGLIEDLFPGMNCPRVGYENLKVQVAKELTLKGFKCSDDSVFANQVDKCIQMYETQMVRHTTMIVGPTGGGKSLILEVLKYARLLAEGITVKYYILNPKKQPLGELYGVMDPLTRDWKDGILSKLFREVNSPLAAGRESEMRYIVFDGDVDAVWVENMNSVMDDNKLLTLPNGERIRLQPHCGLVCETFDLQYASPATISRCGMVWVDPKNLGYKPFFERWVRLRYWDGVSVNEERRALAEVMEQLYDRYVFKSIEYVLSGIVNGVQIEKLRQVVPITALDMVKQLCDSLDAFLPLQVEDRADMEGIFIFSLIWSVGASLVGESRDRFDEFVKTLGSGSTNLPKKSIYQYHYDISSHRWESWEPVPYIQPSPFRFHEVMVPTVDSTVHSYLLSHLLQCRPVLFVGESGSAKTTTVERYLKELDLDKHACLLINLSSRTTAKDVQTSIEASVDKRAGSVYGPPLGKKLMIFIDDTNMPKVDQYGTQQPIALLHFLISKGSMYDYGKELNMKQMKDMHYIGAMGPPGGGRNNVDPRFIALFNVYNINPASEESLNFIFSAIIAQRFEHFSESVQKAANECTSATLMLFKTISQKFLPTPSKFHYIFNLRDLSRVFEGLCLATEDYYDSGPSIVRLWRNECTRVFGDRLVQEDLLILQQDLCSTIQSAWNSSISEIALQNPLVFGDFETTLARLKGESNPTKPEINNSDFYIDIGTYEKVRDIFEELLESYNVDHNQHMNLVLFESALEHLLRIHRVLKTPRGHALLVGMGGSGKKSLCRLASYCAGYEVFEIKLFRNYGESDFRNDLKELYKRLVLKPIVFMLTDAHILQEGFMEYVNNMLTAGVVSALFDKDEIEVCRSIVRPMMKQAGLLDTPELSWQYFLSRCREHLHIVLCMSPSGDKLRFRCRNFPGTISATTIDWFKPWPADALQEVAEYFLTEESSIPESLRKSIVGHLVLTHQSILAYSVKFAEEVRRHYYVTPANYLDYISTYRTELKEKGRYIANRINRLEGGLRKLEEAAIAVDEMQTELTAKKIIVDQKTKSVEAMIAEIQIKSEIANRKQADASLKQEEATMQSEVIAREKLLANDALMEALPAVEAAALALENLDKKDMDEIKVFTNPPQLVKEVCFQVCALRPGGEKYEETWADAKKMLGNSHLLENLKNYPKDGITSKMMASVKRYFSKNSSLTVQNMKTSSKAGTGLLTWVVAISKYYDVAKNVEPLRVRVKDMERAQQVTAKELSDLMTLLESLNIEICTLNEDYEKSSTELSQLQLQASIMEKRLSAASKLITRLTGERDRWTLDVEELLFQRERIIGDCLIGASFLSYLGAFTADFRNRLLHDVLHPDIVKRGVPITSPCNVEALLTTEAQIQEWSTKGLPSDSHSVQNGILTSKASRFPLCIDPQQQAANWIKATYSDSQLCVKTLNEPDFMKHLELAIQFGNPFLFENLDEELDPMLDSILGKQITQNGMTKTVTLGDKVIDWDDNFKLFMTTKLANPHYLPEIMGKTMIVNYGVTMDGLASQLLNVVVSHERPDLEESYALLVTEMSQSTSLLVTLENKLLKELSSSEGNILDNEDLINTLDKTKGEAEDIKVNLEKAQFTKDEISSARSAYKPAAKRGSILYFLVSGLSILVSMYETSLESFLTVFRTALDTAKKDAILDIRLENMNCSITLHIYEYMCIGIFERHKLMFSFQMACMIMDGSGSLPRSELNFFLKGDMSLSAPHTSTPCSWLSPRGWKDLLQLSTMGPMFSSLLAHFSSVSGMAMWKLWYDLETPELVKFPDEEIWGDNKGLSGLQKLCIMRCFRPDRVYNTAKLMVASVLGESYVQPPVLDYRRIYSQSSPVMPMLFILSPGADPLSDIQALGEELGFTGSRFKFLALGQGQGVLAEKMMEQGYQKGHWVLLQNCHLLTSWLKSCEKMLLRMRSPHPDFRLWLTTEPTEKFPLGILQRSLKVVTEPPNGLKLNMRATYSKIDASLLEECPHWAFKPCMYILAHLHAVVIERRKYGKIGWNVPYDFNASDFTISRRLLSLYLTKAHEDGDEFLPWGSLKYLIGDAMYGGRVSDDMDRRVLSTYLNEFMGDFIFDSCQKFYFSKAGHDYKIPELGPLSTYSRAIEEIPLTSSPAVFGLNPNAEIGYFSACTRDMWHDLIALQPRTASSDNGPSREDQIMHTAEEILQKIPLTSIDVGSYDLMSIQREIMKTNGGKAPTPVQVVLLQELERWNALVIKMFLSLTDLKKALTGSIGMNDNLDLLGTSLLNGFLPDSWKRLAPHTEKRLGAWMIHFQSRYDQYLKWLEFGNPKVMWLAGLHVPESYFTALVQTTCRKRCWALDRSTLYTMVTSYKKSDEISEPLEDGCYVSGLFLEGAGWDQERQALCRQEPKVLTVELPILQVIPIEASKLKLQNTFKTPVYVTSNRRNAMGVGLVTMIDLRSYEHPSHWVLQGVAATLESVE